MLSFEINKQTETTLSLKWLKQVADIFGQENKLKGGWYFSLAFVDSKTIKRLNKKYRGQDKVTDVLSFEEDFKNFVNVPIDRKYLGEIVICVPQAKKQAKDIKCSFKNEIARLLIHGLAHLSGYDHEKVGQGEAAKMLKFEKKILERLKIWDVFKFEEDQINC
ncbi:MAG: rRNA maturation RNase YbeY [Candidatus Buchananbacteria bacterium]|nr:rRNA maturation RNase YbeY [Candidatus Buchananbacteria bacterium]